MVLHLTLDSKATTVRVCIANQSCAFCGFRREVKFHFRLPLPVPLCAAAASSANHGIHAPKHGRELNTVRNCATGRQKWRDLSVLVCCNSIRQVGRRKHCLAHFANRNRTAGCWAILLNCLWHIGHQNFCCRGSSPRKWHSQEDADRWESFGIPWRLD